MVVGFLLRVCCLKSSSKVQNLPHHLSIILLLNLFIPPFFIIPFFIFAG